MLGNYQTCSCALLYVKLVPTRFLSRNSYSALIMSLVQVYSLRRNVPLHQRLFYSVRVRARPALRRYPFPKTGASTPRGGFVDVPGGPAALLSGMSASYQYPSTFLLFYGANSSDKSIFENGSDFPQARGPTSLYLFYC